MTTDNFGRTFAGSGGTIDELIKGLRSNTDNVIKTESPKSEQTLDKLYGAVNDLAKRIDSGASKDIKEASLLVREALKFSGGKASVKGRSATGEAEHLKKISDSTSRLWKASQSKNTIWVGVSKFDNKSQRQLTEVVKDALSANNKNPSSHKAMSNGIAQAVKHAVKGTAGGAGGSGMGGGGGGGGSFGPAGFGRGWSATAAQMLRLPILLHKNMVNAFKINPIEHIFSGVLEESNNFRESMRQIVHQTQGFGDSNRELEKTYNDITDAVNATGVRRGEFQRIWLKNLERGFSLEERQRKRSMSVQTSALHTAQQLGMNTESINDLFMDWHTHLSLSSLDLASIGRHMQNVARTTGITGTQLEAAAKSSERIMKSLKSAGLATATAAKNVIELSAVMQKFGVGEKGAEMMQALTSRRNFMAAAPEMKSMLGRVAGATGNRDMMNSVMSGGVLQSKSQTKAFAGGLEKEIRNALSNFAGDFQRMGIDMSQIKVDDLSAMQQDLSRKGPEGERLAGVIDQVMANRFAGMGPGDLEQMMKGLQEFGKTYPEQIGDILSKMDMLKKKDLAGGEEFQRLQRKLLETQTSQYTDAFSTVQAELKKTGGTMTEDARKNIVKSLTDSMGAEKASAFAGDLSGGVNDYMKKLGERASKSGLNLDSLLKESGLNATNLKKGLIGGDESINEALQNVVQKIEKKERVGQDPVTDIRNTLTELNTKLGALTDGVLGKISGWLAKLVFFAAEALILGGEILAAIMVFKAFKGLAGGGGLGGMFGGTPTMPIPGGGVAGKAVPGIGGVAAAGAAGAPAAPAGKKGFFGKIGGLMGKHSGKLGAFGGGVAGYAMSDDHPILGTAIGAGAGFGISKLLKSKGGGVMNSLGNVFTGMPGYGENCVPVCIVGGTLDGIGGIGGVGGVADMALGGLNTASDIKDLTGGTKSAAGSGRFSRMMSKVPGGTRAMNFMSGVGTKASGLWQGAKAAPVLGGAISGGGKLLSGASTVLGKATGPLALLGGALVGAGQAEAAGRSTTGGAIYGALTGSATTGSMFSESLGIQKGGAGDEAMGVLGAAGSGALSGAAIGSFIPVIGTAVGAGVGAVVGAGTEIVKLFTSEDSKIKQAIVGFGSSLWEGTKGLASSLWDGVKGIGSAIGNAASAATSFVVDGVKSIGGAIADKAVAAGSFVADAAASVGGAVANAASNVGGAIADAASWTGDKLKSGWNSVTGWLGFADGTPRISTGGLAYLHKGETVLPPELGIGARAEQGGLANMMSSVTGALGGGMIGTLRSVFDKLNPFTAFSSMVGRGLFGRSENIDEAMEQSVDSAKRGTSADINNVTNKDLNKVVSTVLETKRQIDQSKQTKDLVAEVSRSLNYGTSGSDAATDAMVSSSLMDYRDEMRGEISTLGLSRTGIESSLEREKYAEGVSGSATLLPSMDTIQDYLLNTQLSKLDDMIELLEKIKENTSGTNTFSSIIGKIGNQFLPSTTPSIKSVARDNTRGFWDLTFGDAATGNVTTDGRGGSA